MSINSFNRTQLQAGFVTGPMGAGNANTWIYQACLIGGRSLPPAFQAVPDIPMEGERGH